jgi:poly(A) polymerase/tRNA nucleotidyltransferase (CCA-adding enzyme)
MTRSPDTDAPTQRIAPPAILAEPAFAALLDALPAARIVGGAVRDALAGRPADQPTVPPTTDIDLATPLPPVAVMAALQRAGIRAVPTGLAHGTVTAVLDGTSAGTPVEITTLRRDVATDGRHAIVAFTDDWRQDAARRDFTINAMSMTRDGAVYDYFGGVADLRAGIVRFVGDPAQRIAEDYLRVLRYFRFYARYAAQPPAPPVQAALRAGIPGLAQLSAERVWSELQRILAAPDPRAAIQLMAALDILAAVIPEGADPAALDRLIASGAPVDPLLRLAALLNGNVDTFADRLRLSAEHRQRLLDLRLTPLTHPDDDDAGLRRNLADHARGALIDRTWLAHAAGDTVTHAGWTALRASLETLSKPRFPLEGRDVLALGLAPGPRVGALLRTVRAWWLAGGCTADAASCRAELSRQIDTQYAQIDNAAQIDIAAQIDHAAQIDNAAQTDKPEQIDTATQTDAAVTNHE